MAPSLPGTDLQAFLSELCPVASVLLTRSAALYTRRENFLEVGLGYSNEGVRVFLRKS